MTLMLNLMCYVFSTVFIEYNWLVLAGTAFGNIIRAVAELGSKRPDDATNSNMTGISQIYPYLCTQYVQDRHNKYIVTDIDIKSETPFFVHHRKQPAVFIEKKLLFQLVLELINSYKLQQSQAVRDVMTGPVQIGQVQQIFTDQLSGKQL